MVPTEIVQPTARPATLWQNLKNPAMLELWQTINAYYGKIFLCMFFLLGALIVIFSATMPSRAWERVVFMVIGIVFMFLSLVTCLVQSLLHMTFVPKKTDLLLILAFTLGALILGFSAAVHSGAWQRTTLISTAAVLLIVPFAAYVVPPLMNIMTCFRAMKPENSAPKQ